MKLIQRKFIPGSEWLFFKLYTGNKTADKILVNNIYPAINLLTKRGLIKKWFFIRYTDPDFHLRLRLLAADNKSVCEIINVIYLFLYKLINTNQVWKIQIDTYNREIERYNKILIEDTETFFYIDSECILALMRKLRQYDEKYQWMIALKMIDNLFSDFSYDLQKKQNLMYNMSSSFKVEFGFNQHNQKQLNTKYREHKHIIENILLNKINDNLFDNLCKLLRNKKDKKDKTIQNLVKKAKENNIDLAILLPSYIHMTLNRLFSAKHRVYELLIYDFMYRFYSDEIIRSKNNYNQTIF